MGFGDESKKSKKAGAAAEAARQQQADAEDADWAAGEKGANKKKEAAAEKAAAKAQRKAEADEQAAEEDAAFSKPKEKKKDKGGGAKMTRAEIAAKAMKAMEEKKKGEKKEAIEIAKSGGNEYIGVLKENDNKSSAIDASGIDGAIAALDVAGSSSSAGDGKKVNAKVLFKAFEEAEIERLKAENPGLKLSQLKERAFQAWQKSPENPANFTPEIS